MKVVRVKASFGTAAAAVIAALLIACAALFVFMRARLTRLQNALTLENARASLLERELDELKESHDKLLQSYAELEKTKAEEKDAPRVYLTFDDGPSDNTEKILDTLAKYNVKATFFIIGKQGGKAAALYRRLADEGHAVGNHTYSHKYSEIYSSTEKFWEQYEKNDEFFYTLTGRHLTLLRFPGGSNNTVSERYCRGIMNKLTRQAKERGINYFDWNVSSLDAEAEHQKKSVIINAVLSQCKGKKRAVVLMHDNSTKKTTAEALPEIIETLKARGFVFDTLDNIEAPVRFK